MYVPVATRIYVSIVALSVSASVFVAIWRVVEKREKAPKPYIIITNTNKRTVDQNKTLVYANLLGQLGRRLVSID